MGQIWEFYIFQYILSHQIDLLSWFILIGAIIIIGQNLPSLCTTTDTVAVKMLTR